MKEQIKNKITSNILLQTNLMVSLILLIGFTVIGFLGYKANYDAYLVKTEQVAALANEGIYYRLTTILTKPVNVAQTMAHDNLLVEVLGSEGSRWQTADYQQTISAYLQAYKAKYQYDSVFLVATATSNYYNFNGLDRQLQPDDVENTWYYNFIQGDDDYALNIDNDQVAGADNTITLFVNCKIRNAAGQVIGVVGVGVNINDLQALLEQYRNKYNVESCLIDETGLIQVSDKYSGYERVDWFQSNDSEKLRRQVLEWKNGKSNWDVWMPGNVQSGEKSYLVVRYIPDLSWYLLVKQDTGAVIAELNARALKTLALIIAVIVIIIGIITSVIKKFNRKMTRLQEEKQKLFQEATEQIYDNIYEMNITKNCAVGARTKMYFEALGASNLPYDEFLQVVADKQIKEEFREGYLATFARERVLQELSRGNNYLQYEMMITHNGSDYLWMNVDAYIFYSAADASVHMFAYRKNIDEAKRKELAAERRASLDEMTGTYTKMATERIITKLLKKNSAATYGFFMVDLDNFKQVNDQYGHIFGDYCIETFAAQLKSYCREDDVVGRIGGDEFVVFGKIASPEAAHKQAERLCKNLETVCEDSGCCWQMSVSIGIALAPQDGTDFATLYAKADKALYQRKKMGKNGYTFYDDSSDVELKD